MKNLLINEEITNAIINDPYEENLIDISFGDFTIPILTKISYSNHIDYKLFNKLKIFTNNKKKEKTNYYKTEIELYSYTENIKNPKISIIIPAYNVEKYIGECLLSIIKQTFKELEIIIINDGSTDRTEEIIKLFMKDKRIKLISQENKKQGAARNRGLKVATGEYIGYIDSDDWIDLDYFEKLYNSAKKYDADIAIATNIRVGGSKKAKNRLNIDSEKAVSSLKEKFEICNHLKNECPTNKIYRLSMLKENKITWPEGSYCEDKLYVTKAIYYANKIVSVPNIYYYYFRNPKSTVFSKGIKFSEDKNNARLAVIQFLRDKKAFEIDGQYWGLNYQKKIFGIPIFIVKESICTKQIIIVGLIKFKRGIL